MNFTPYDKYNVSSTKTHLLSELNIKTNILLDLNIRLESALKNHEEKINEIKNINKQIEELSLKAYYIGTKTNEALDNLNKITDAVNKKIPTLEKIDDFLNKKPPERKGYITMGNTTLFIIFSVIIVGFYNNK